MNLLQLISIIEALHFEMDASIEQITLASSRAQSAIYDMLLQEIYNFEISEGRFVLGQPFTRRIAVIQRKMQEILGGTYSHSVKEYLNAYSTVEQKNIAIQKDYNELEVDLKYISPARQAAYSQAEYFLTNAIQDAYIQPVKYLLMQQVSTGVSIKDSQRILKSWNEGKTEEKILSVRPTPTLDSYATQVARDTLYKFNGTINNIISKEYGFNRFIYVGGLIKDSRPLCRHLVGLRRKISLDEMPELIERYPRGLYPNTTKDNFMAVCGGFNCLHGAYPVR